MLPVIEAFMSAHDLAEVTVVAEAGMISEANREVIEDAGLSFIIGERIPEVPYVIKQWRREKPDAVPEDGQAFTAPWPATGKRKAAVKRNRFVKLTGGSRTINRDLESKARALAGSRPTSPTSTTPRPSS